MTKTGENAFEGVGVDDVLARMRSFSSESAAVQQPSKEETSEGDEGGGSDVKKDEKYQQAQSTPVEELEQSLGVKFNPLEATKDEGVESGKEDNTDDTNKDSKKIEDNQGQEGAPKESNLYLHVAALKEEGVLSDPDFDLEEFKKLEPEDQYKKYIDLSSSVFEKGKEEYKEQLSDNSKKYLELLEKGVPEVQAQQQATAEYAYQNLKDEELANDEAVQEYVIREDYRIKGMSDSQIDAVVEGFKEKEILFEQSKASHSSILSVLQKERDALVAKAEDDNRKAQERAAKYQEDVSKAAKGMTEIFPGIEITEGQRKQMIEYATKPIEYETLPDGTKQPVSYIQKLSREHKEDFILKTLYLAINGYYDGTMDTKKFMTKVQSNTSKKIKNKLFEGDSKSGSGRARISDSSKQNADSDETPRFPISFNGQ